MKTNSSAHKRSRLFWILQLSGWSAYFLISVFIFFRDKPLEPVMVAGLFITHFTGFLTSFILHVVLRRLYRHGRPILKLALTTLGLIFILSIVWFALDLIVSVPLRNLNWMAQQFTYQTYTEEFFWYTFPLVIWGALYFMITFWMESREQRERAEKALLLARDAQLRMLRYQMNPHFLFNALNSIRALIDENRIKAKDMITELSEFLRYSLTHKDALIVPLKEELEAVRHYLLIEEKRFEEKMVVTYDIDPLAEEYPVLVYMIYPLVENAIKHGMKSSPLPLRIKIAAKVKDEQLAIEVCNSGRWLDSPQNAKISTGTGLSNLQQRLGTTLKERFYFSIFKGEHKVCVLITLKAKINPGMDNGTKSPYR